MKFLKKTQFSPIGLDLGSTAVRGVQLWRRGETIDVYSAHEIKIKPSSALGDDEAEAILSMMEAPVYPEKSHLLENNSEDSLDQDLADMSETSQDNRLRDSISRLIYLGGFKGRKVMIQCPVEHLDMRPVALPAGPEGLSRDIVMGVLRHQLSDHVSFAIEQAVIDYSVLDYDSHAKQLNIMAFSADGNWIEQQILTLRSLKLNCVGVAPMPFALSQLTSVIEQRTGGLTESTAKDELVGVLDIGYTGTTLVVLHGGKPVFSRRFALGGQKMTRLLSQHLMIDPAQAERLKVKFGLYCHAEAPLADSENGSKEYDLHIAKTIFTALQAELDDFTEGVIRSLNYVISQQRGARMTKLLLSGTASHLKHLDSYLAQQLEIPVEPLSNPLLTELLRAMPASRATNGSWCVATGLALAEFTENPKQRVVQAETAEVG